MDTLDLIYEVFDEIKKAEENQDFELLEIKKKQLENLRMELARFSVNRKASTSAVEKLLLKSKKS